MNLKDGHAVFGALTVPNFRSPVAVQVIGPTIAALLAATVTSVPGSPMKWGTWNSLGTMIPSPALDEQGAALRTEIYNTGITLWLPAPRVRTSTWGLTW